MQVVKHYLPQWMTFLDDQLVSSQGRLSSSRLLRLTLFLGFLLSLCKLDVSASPQVDQFAQGDGQILTAHLSFLPKGSN